MYYIYIIHADTIIINVTRFNIGYLYNEFYIHIQSACFPDEKVLHKLYNIAIINYTAIRN